jgi:hypothetical protein
MNAPAAPPLVRFVVGGYQVDWVLPLAACAILGFTQLGVIGAVVMFGLNVTQCRVITIGIAEGEGWFCVTRPWAQELGARTVILGAQLSHWHTWYCRGLELRGSNAVLVAAARKARPVPLAMPSGLSAIRRVPPVPRLNLRAALSNLPNLLVATASLVAVLPVGSALAQLSAFLCLLSIGSTVASSLRNAPELDVRGN